MSTLHHSFFLPAALITNTSCELIVPIQCTLHTPNDGSASASHQKRFPKHLTWPNPQEQGIAKCTIPAM